MDAQSIAERRRLLEEQRMELERQQRQLDMEEMRLSQRATASPVGTQRRSSLLGTPSPSWGGSSPPPLVSDTAPLPPLTAAPLHAVALRPGHEEYRAVDGSEVQRVDHEGPENVTERWYTSPDGAVKEYERHRVAPGVEEHIRDEESHYQTPYSETWSKSQSSSFNGVGPAIAGSALPLDQSSIMRMHQDAVNRAMKQAQDQLGWATQGSMSHAAFPAFPSIGGLGGTSIADIHARAVRDAERQMQDMLARSQEQMGQMMRNVCVPSPSPCIY